MEETRIQEGSEGTMNPALRILVVTTEWPAFPGDVLGNFICNQVDSLRSLGARVSIFSFSAKRNPLRYIKALIGLRKKICDEYDILHAHYGNAGLLAVLSGHGKVVVTFHGSDVNGMRNRNGRITIAGHVLKLVSRYVASRAGRAIIVADNMKAELPARAYSTIPCGVNTDIFKPYPKMESRRKLGLRHDGSLVLFVGDPKRPEKRFWLAQEAVKLVNERWRCELVLANGILYDVMPRFMSACDVLLVTSSSEGSPQVVKEALACNLPVVSVDVGDVRQRIAKIDGCEICPSDDPNDIATGLEKVLSRQRRIKGRHVVEELDERAVSLRVMEVYRSLLRDKG